MNRVDAGGARAAPVVAAHTRHDASASTPVIAAVPLASAIYEGWVRHRRYGPHANAFRYRTCMMYLDLAEIDRLFDGRALWSLEKRNVAVFRRGDFFGAATTPLDVCIRDRVQLDTGVRPAGPIRMLTHLRYFGVSFNPVTFYYCFDEDGTTLETIVAEITNTPWKERHAYVLPISIAVRHGSAFAWDFDKSFHVSPFVPMQRRYSWRFTIPGDALRVHMDVLRPAPESTPASQDGHREAGTGKTSPALELDATLVLERRQFNAANLARVLLRYPLMTTKVVAAIHWQALRIFARGNRVYDHPGKQTRPS